jgi:multiple RNA-binding domain-containing protein 1
MLIIQSIGLNVYNQCSIFQVLERAKEGESLEELRARSLARLAAQFTEEQNGFQNPAKLSKKRKDVTNLDQESMKFWRITD